MRNCLFCPSPSVNVGATHCGVHLDALADAQRAERLARETRLRTAYKFYSPELDLGDTEQGARFENTVVAEHYANSVKEYLASASFETTDQDGGTLNYGGFEDAPSAVQDAILKSINITWENYENS